MGGSTCPTLSLLREDDATLAAAVAGDHELARLAHFHCRLAQASHHGPGFEFGRLVGDHSTTKLRPNFLVTIFVSGAAAARWALVDKCSFPPPSTFSTSTVQRTIEHGGIETNDLNNMTLNDKILHRNL